MSPLGLRKAGRDAARAAQTVFAVWLLLGGGCQLLGDSPPYDIPHGTLAAPHGTATALVSDHQQLAAQQFDLVLYNQNWYQGGRQLGPEGERRLNRMIAHLYKTPLPVIIEPHPIVIRRPAGERPMSDEQLYLATVAAARELDEQRRALIVARLADAQVPGAEDRVFVDYPPTGLYGPEAPLIAQQWNFPGAAMGRRGMMGPGLPGVGGRGMGGFGMGSPFGRPGFGGLGGFGGGLGRATFGSGGL